MYVRSISQEQCELDNLLNNYVTIFREIGFLFIFYNKNTFIFMFDFPYAIESSKIVEYCVCWRQFLLLRQKINYKWINNHYLKHAYQILSYIFFQDLKDSANKYVKLPKFYLKNFITSFLKYTNKKNCKTLKYQFSLCKQLGMWSSTLRKWQRAGVAQGGR